MANDKRVADIMRQFQDIESRDQNDEDLAFIKGTIVEDNLSGLKGIKTTLSPTLLTPHPKNVFSMVHDDEYETLKKAIAEYGVTNPIICYKDGEKYVILSGHRRTSCALELGLETVPVNIIEKFDDELDSLTLLGIENMSTRTPSPIDVALFAEEMAKELDKLEIKGRKRDIIAEKIPNLKGRMVQSYMKLLKLPDVYKEWVRLGYINVKNGERIVSLIESKKYSEELKTFKTKGEKIILSNMAPENKEAEFALLIKELFRTCIPDKKRPAQKKKKVKSEIANVNKKIDAMLSSEYIFPKKDSDKKTLKDDISTLIQKLKEIEKELQTQ